MKHFVGYGAAEGGRDYNTTEISEYTLRNFYLPQFRAGVNAGRLDVDDLVQFPLRFPRECQPSHPHGHFAQRIEIPGLRRERLECRNRID